LSDILESRESEADKAAMQQVSLNSSAFKKNAAASGGGV
jgi:hypothetical protein